MDLAEQCGVARHRKRQISHMSEERHPRRAVFVEKVPDHAWKHIDRVRARPPRTPSFRGYAAKRCHAKFLQHLSSSHEYAGRPTETLRRPIGANVGSVGRLADPSRSLLSAARTRATYRNRSHSSLFDEVVLEHIMNKVNQKKTATGLRHPRRVEPSPSHARAARWSNWREAAAITLGWTGTRNFLYKRPSPGAQVAQLVEQRTENPCVGGSIPPLGTIGASVVGSASCSCPPPRRSAGRLRRGHILLSTSPRVALAAICSLDGAARRSSD